DMLRDRAARRRARPRGDATPRVARRRSGRPGVRARSWSSCVACFGAAAKAACRTEPGAASLPAQARDRRRASRVPATGQQRKRPAPPKESVRPSSGRREGDAAPPSPSGLEQAAASLSFFSGRTLTLTEAGLAANHCSSLVKGLMPLRRGLAGTLTAVILSRPGRVKEPAPFLLIEPCTAPSSAAITARTSLAATPVPLAMWATRPDLVRLSLIGFGAAGFAAAFFGATFLAAFFAFFAMCVWFRIRWLIDGPNPSASAMLAKKQLAPSTFRRNKPGLMLPHPFAHRRCAPARGGA